MFGVIYAECHVCYCYAESHVSFIVMLSVTVTCVILLSVVAPSGAFESCHGTQHIDAGC